MERNMQIGQRISQRRRALGLTLDEVSARVGVAKSTIQRYEKGQIHRIKRPVVEAIAGALQVSAEYLLCETEDPAPPHDPAAEVKAALWGGDEDLSDQDLEELWADVREYAAFRARQHKAKKQQ